MTLVKNYISCIIINRGKNTLESVGTVLKKNALHLRQSAFSNFASYVIKVHSYFYVWLDLVVSSHAVDGFGNIS